MPIGWWGDRATVGRVRRFDGHAALVTGAGRGIGAAIARRLSVEGARVLVTDRDGELAGRVAETIDGAAWTGCDVADDAAVVAAVAQAVERFGRLDVLVNNAASCGLDAPRFEDEADDTWERDLDVTLTGAFRCSRAAWRTSPPAAGGRSSTSARSTASRTSGTMPTPLPRPGWRPSRAPSPVRWPGAGSGRHGRAGMIRTPNWDGRQDELDALAGIYPLGRVGEPDDIAAAVAFLASSDAAWITGTSLRVDGGLLAVNTAFVQALADASATQSGHSPSRYREPG